MELESQNLHNKLGGTAHAYNQISEGGEDRITGAYICTNGCIKTHRVTGTEIWCTHSNTSR